MNIQADCFTNLDDFKREEWPKFFAFPPKVGDYVEAFGGKRLKIVAIYHCTLANNNHGYCRIELNK